MIAQIPDILGRIRDKVSSSSAQRRSRTRAQPPEAAVYTVALPELLFPAVVALRSVADRNPGRFLPFVVVDSDRLTEAQRAMVAINGVELLEMAAVRAAARSAAGSSAEGLPETVLSWAVPDLLRARGYERALKVDPHMLCMGPLDVLDAFEGHTAIALTKHRQDHGIGAATRAFQEATGLRLSKNQQTYDAVAFLDTRRLSEGDFLGTFIRAREELLRLLPENPRVDRLALSAAAITFGEGFQRLPRALNFKPRGHVPHLKPQEDVRLLHYADQPLPWEPLEFRHVQKLVKRGYGLTLAARDAWLVSARQLEGFEEFTSQRPGGPMGKLKVANQVEKARQLLAQDEQRRRAERSSRRLEAPFRVWGGPETFIPTRAVHYASLDDGAQYDFLHLPSEGPAEKLFVFFSGYADRRKAKPPVFQRWTWADQFPGHCLYFSDPALHLADTASIGYYAGAAAGDYLERIAEIVLQVAMAHGISPENIVTYGSSAGGFASLRMADHLRGATHIAINPQTDLSVHREEKVRSVVRRCYGVSSLEELEEPLRARFTVHRPELLERAGRILVMQNRLDTYHVENHYRPYLKFAAQQRSPDAVTTYEFDHRGGHRGGESKDAFRAALAFADQLRGADADAKSTPETPALPCTAVGESAADE